MRTQKLTGFFCSLLFLFTVTGSSLASVNENSYYDYLKGLYLEKNPKLNDYLMDECYKFLKMYSQGPRAAEVRYVAGLLHLEKGNHSEAIATFLKGLFLDPASDRMNDQREQIRKTIDRQKHFRKMKDVIDRATEGPFIQKPMEAKFYDYLRILYEMDDRVLYPFMLKESKMYVVNFPGSVRVEDIIGRTAQLYSTQSKFEEAISSYQKIEYLFPGSPNVPQNKLTVAKIRYNQIKDYEGAKTDFTFITDNYPGKDVAAEAYFYLGELNKNRFGNLSEAIHKYQTVASNYMASPLAVESLFRVSDIYLKDLKDNENAIETLSKIGRDFSGDARAPEAFDRIAQIYSRNMKDYDSAITTYKKLAETYPENPISPSRMFRAGELAEKNLKDFGNAINLYEELVSMFPDSKEAKNGKKKIASLRKKISSKY